MDRQELNDSGEAFRVDCFLCTEKNKRIERKSRAAEHAASLMLRRLRGVAYMSN